MPDTLTPNPPTQPNPQKQRTRPPPRHVLNYLGRLGPAQRRVRSTLFSREHWANFLKSLPWVVPLTVLIWVYAEREQLADDPKVPIPIEVRTSDPNRIARID